MSEERVLLLNTDFERGGTPTVVKELAIRLRARGHDVAAACLAAQGPVAREMQDAGVPVTSLGARGALDLAAFSRLEELVSRGRFAAVLSFLVHANVAAALISRHQTAIRWLQSIQTTQPRPRWHWLAQRWAARHARRIIVPSRSIAQCAAARSGIKPAKITVIPNGVQLERFAGIQRRLGFPAAIGFIGRLDPVKRLPDLLAAAALLRDRTAVHIFGEGSQRSHIESLIARQGIGGQVTLRGAVASPEEAFAQIGLLVLCSQAEGMPMVLLEAMAAGVPIVASDAPGIRDTVEHERSALLFPVGDAQAMANAIQRLLDDGALRDRLRVQALERVRDLYAWDRIIPQYEAILFPPQS